MDSATRSDMNANFEQAYSTQQVADQLNIGKSTVNKYSRSMEENGYRFTKDDSERRAYIEGDIIALRELMSLLEKGVTYDSAIKAVVARFSKDNTNSIAPLATQNKRYDSRYMELEQQIQALARVVQDLQLREQQRPALPTPEELREQEFRSLSTHRRIVSKLQEEAASNWEQLPRNERMKSFGLFFKAEDLLKREKFIESYINEHYDSRLRKDYGLD